MNVSAPPIWALAAADLKITDPDQRKLYDLIWKRTLASQMASAKLERTTAEIGSADGQVGLRATGQVVLFDGFMKVYEEGRDDAVLDDDDKRLPAMAKGDATAKTSVTPRTAFHPTPAALYRGVFGQTDGGTGHWPPVHLCQYCHHDSGPWLCSKG